MTSNPSLTNCNGCESPLHKDDLLIPSLTNAPGLEFTLIMEQHLHLRECRPYQNDGEPSWFHCIERLNRSCSFVLFLVDNLLWVSCFTVFVSGCFGAFGLKLSSPVRNTN